MSFTRFHDDPTRIRKQLQQSSGLCRYQLDAPGPGILTPFIEDPQVRLQKWGANLKTNTVNLESDLRGIGHKLSVDDKDYSSLTPSTNNRIYGSQDAFVDESRASHPAWMYRDLEHSRWTTSFHDVQKKTEIPFSYNEPSRILEKNKVRNNNNNNNNNSVIEGLDETDPNGGGGLSLSNQATGENGKGTKFAMV
tara:strand:- start:459 stop:1040 length:582 start_codon:yes stop_codon:yes gene_type:complete